MENGSNLFLTQRSLALVVDGLRSQHFEGRCWKNDCFYVPTDCEQ